MKKLIYALAIIPFLAVAATDSVVTPTEREDGTPIDLKEIAGFMVYCGSAIGDYTSDAFIEGAVLPNTTLEYDTPIGTSYCVYTTVDTDGRESLFSNPVTVNNYAAYPPGAPWVPIGRTINVITILQSPD